MKILDKLFRIYDDGIRVVVSILGLKFKFKSEYLEYKRVMEANLKKLSKLLWKKLSLNYLVKKIFLILNML